MSSQINATETRFVILSGCSGGGKSTLLAELNQRGYPSVPEPGRRIVAQELATNGVALPWVDPAAFLHRAIALAQADHRAASSAGGWVFFDRGLVDAVSALAHLTGLPVPTDLPRYHRQVFLTPPWPEIYVQDGERQHGLDAAVAEYERLLQAYPALGYNVTIVPRLAVAERADFVLAELGL